MQGRAIRLLFTAATSIMKGPISTYLIESVATTTVVAVVVAAHVHLQEKYDRTEVSSLQPSSSTVELLSSSILKEHTILLRLPAVP